MSPLLKTISWYQEPITVTTVSSSKYLLDVCYLQQNKQQCQYWITSPVSWEANDKWISMSGLSCAVLFSNSSHIITMPNPSILPPCILNFLYKNCVCAGRSEPLYLKVALPHHYDWNDIASVLKWCERPTNGRLTSQGHENADRLALSLRRGSALAPAGSIVG